MQQQNIFSHIFINLIGLTAQLDICVCAIVENFFTYLPVWPDLAKFHHFCKNITTLATFWWFSIWQKVWTYFGKKYAVGQIFIVVNGQILNIYLAIWSLCYLPQWVDLWWYLPRCHYSKIYTFKYIAKCAFDWHWCQIKLGSTYAGMKKGSDRLFILSL